jgi:hypothetical protein
LKTSDISAVPPGRLLATFRTDARSRSYGRDYPAVAVPLHSENLHARPRSAICVASHTLRLSAARARSPISTESEADPRLFAINRYAPAIPIGAANIELLAAKRQDNFLLIAVS